MTHSSETGFQRAINHTSKVWGETWSANFTHSIEMVYNPGLERVRQL